MTPTQYRTAIAKLGLSQRGAAAFLKIDERTSRRWALGESPIPEGYAMLLRLMVRLNLTPVEVD
jgi:hypothetical protein